MIDIMMTLAVIPDCFLFIGKKELAKFPLFGYFYKRTNILVDRKSLSSRKKVYHQAAAELAQGVGVAIYPEGGIPEASYKLAPFKAGAFKLAAESHVAIVPIVYYDNKYKMPDWHIGGYPGVLRAKILDPITPESLSEDELKELCYQRMLEELNQWRKA
jgi:1-acyl-sn-glycerol-3-phosphate acyltransferase